MYDPESPIQDADIEMAGLQEIANRSSRLRKRGICVHGGYRSGTPTVCSECGKEFPTEDHLLEERRELLI